MEVDDSENDRKRDAVKTIDILENRLKATEEIEKEGSKNVEEPLSIRGRIVYWILRGLMVFCNFSDGINRIVTLITATTGDNYFILIRDRMRKRREWESNSTDLGVQCFITNNHI